MKLTNVSCKSTNCFWNNAQTWNAKGYCTKDEIELDLKDIKRHDGEWYDYTDCSDYEYAHKGEVFRK